MHNNGLAGNIDRPLQLTAANADNRGWGGQLCMGLIRGAWELPDFSALIIETTHSDRRFKSANIRGLIKLKIIEGCLTVLTELEFGAVTHLSFDEATGPGENNVSLIKHSTLRDRLFTAIGMANSHLPNHQFHCPNFDQSTPGGRRTSKLYIEAKGPRVKAFYHGRAKPSTIFNHQIRGGWETKIVCNSVLYAAGICYFKIKTLL